MDDRPLGGWPEPCEQEGCTAHATREVAAFGVPGGAGESGYATLHLCAAHAHAAREWCNVVRNEPLRPLTHRRLLGIVKALPTDYAPWGDVERWADGAASYPDCSGGCRWFAELDGPLGSDWGCCTSPTGPRSGLLTFEHQGGFGCFEQGEDDERG